VAGDGQVVNDLDVLTNESVGDARRAESSNTGRRVALGASVY